jgi:hypothetical protein
VSTPQQSVAYADPLHAGRHPFQTFLLGLCVISGVPLAFGERTASSISALLPGWMAVGWGVSLSLGALVALVGSYWPRTSYATALTLERVGLVIVGPAAVVYACVIFIYGGWGGATAGLITLAFGASALQRAHDIGKVIHRAIAITEGEPMPRVLREGETP